jgi:hypothetical protein
MAVETVRRLAGRLGLAGSSGPVEDAQLDLFDGTRPA